MKKKMIALLLCLTIVFCAVMPSNFAYADIAFLTQIAGAAYAVMSGAGINFTAGAATSLGMQNFMETQITSYCTDSGKSLVEAFGQEQLKTVAGKLAIGQIAYNGIVDFVDWLSDIFVLSDEESALSEGTIDGKMIGTELVAETNLIGEGIEIVASTQKIISTGDVEFAGYRYMRLYIDGRLYNEGDQSAAQNNYTGQYSISIDSANNKFKVIKGVATARNGQIILSTQATTWYPIPAGSRADTLDWQESEDYVQPTVIGTGYEWQGTVEGAQQDTNLEQLIALIFDAIGLNDLGVDSEIVEPGPAPTPVPTPQPTTAPDTLLPDVPLEAIDELFGDLEDTIDTQTDTIVDSLEGVEEAVGSLEGTIEGALDVPEMRKFDLRTLFPFCIPFDIARILGAFDGVAVAPHVQLPIVIPSINFSYTMDLDFSAFDSVAAVLRQVELIAFAIALAFATSKVIRW